MAKSTPQFRIQRWRLLDMAEGEAYIFEGRGQQKTKSLTMIMIRICPGRHMSNESMALMIASLLAVFEIKPPEDEKGRPLPVNFDTASDVLA
jgi:hypothetical protein